jgi:hypothetical protein
MAVPALVLSLAAAALAPALGRAVVAGDSNGCASMDSMDRSRSLNVLSSLERDEALLDCLPDEREEDDAGVFGLRRGEEDAAAAAAAVVDACTRADANVVGATAEASKGADASFDATCAACAGRAI